MSERRSSRVRKPISTYTDADYQADSGDDDDDTVLGSLERRAYGRKTVTKKKSSKSSVATGGLLSMFGFKKESGPSMVDLSTGCPQQQRRMSSRRGKKSRIASHNASKKRVSSKKGSIHEVGSEGEFDLDASEEDDDEDMEEDAPRRSRRCKAASKNLNLKKKTSRQRNGSRRNSSRRSNDNSMLRRSSARNDGSSHVTYMDVGSSGDEEDCEDEEEEEEEEDEEAVEEDDEEEQQLVVQSLALSKEQHEELAAEGWCFDHSLVGEFTRRLFRCSNPHMVDGRLVAYIEASGEDPPMWKNMHEDGELEDLEYHEVKTARLNFRLELALPRGGIFAEDLEDYNTDEDGETGSYRTLDHKYPNQPPPDSKEMIGLVAQRVAKERDALEKDGFLLSGSANFAWYPHLNRFVGRRTRRFFRTRPDEPVDGRIVGFILPQGDEPAYFKNLHDQDGEMEDLEVIDMRAAHHAFKHGVKRLGAPGIVGFYDAKFADDPSDGEYDGNPEEDDKWLEAIENEDLSAMPECFVGGEPLAIQSVVATYTATAKEWKRLLRNVSTSKVGKDGSVFTRRIEGPYDSDEEVGAVSSVETSKLSGNSIELADEMIKEARQALCEADEDDEIDHAHRCSGDKTDENVTNITCETQMKLAASEVFSNSDDQVASSSTDNITALSVAMTSTTGIEDSHSAMATEVDDVVPIKKYLMKWKGTSHLHVSWETPSVLRRVFDQRATQAINTFSKKVLDDVFLNDYGVHLDTDDDDEMQSFSSPTKRCVSSKKRLFVNPQFVAVERILDAPGLLEVRAGSTDETSSKKWPLPSEVCAAGTNQLLLVKWRGLGYSCATLERADEVPDAVRAVELYYARESYIKSSRSRKGRRNRDISQADLETVLPQEYEGGGSLRDYQRKGVTWMLYNWHNNRSSLLADEMGLGKTLQTVSYLRQLHERYHVAGPFLVVAPLSTLTHWQREFERWTNMDVVQYCGSADDRAVFREHEFFFKPHDSNGSSFDSEGVKRVKNAPKLQVLVTSFENITNTDSYHLRGIKWSVVVVDEAHRLKNVHSKFAIGLRMYEFDQSLLLTGTPLQNNTREFWSLLNFLDHDSFASGEEFAEKFGDLQRKEQLDALTAETRKYMLRRMKEDVEKSMPPKEETRVSVELTLMQKTYYRALFEKNISKLIPKGKRAADGPSLMNVAMELRKCCNHPFLLRGVRDEMLSKIPAPTPTDIAEAGGAHLARLKAETDALVETSGKLVFLDKLLPKLHKEGHRVLIFSQFKIMLDLLEDFLEGRHFKYERLDGDVTGTDRQACIDRYQAEGSTSFVMLLSTKAGGVGINLMAADTCIIYDSDFNPQNDLQAQARCHRIGQTKEVKVYRLLCAKTYEMKMCERASHKLALDKAVLGSSAPGTTPMSKREVEELLKRGAYDFFSDPQASDESSAMFMEASIDEILATNTMRVVEEKNVTSDGMSNTFASASFEQGSEEAAEAAAAAEVEGEDETIKQRVGGRRKKNDDGTDEKEKEIDIDDPNFWQSLGLSGNDDESFDADDIDFLEGRAGPTNGQTRRQRKGKAKVDYTDNGVPIIIGLGADTESDADEDENTGDEENTSTPKRRKKEWTFKEFEAARAALNCYGIYQWSSVYTEIIEAGLSSKDKKRLAASSDIDDEMVPPKWTDDEMKEMSGWILFKCMQVLVDTNKKNAFANVNEASLVDGNIVVAPTNIEDSSGDQSSSCTPGATTHEDECNGLSTSVAGTMDENLSKHPTGKGATGSLTTMESLLVDYPWCQDVMRMLCVAIDERTKATSKELDAAKVLEAAEKAASWGMDLSKDGIGIPNEDDSVADSSLAPTDSSITAKECMVDADLPVTKEEQIGALAQQVNSMLSTLTSKKTSQRSSVQSGSTEGTNEIESSLPLVVSAGDFGHILGRYTPKYFDTKHGKKFCAGLSENIAKRILKPIDELWWINKMLALLEVDTKSPCSEGVSSDVSRCDTLLSSVSVTSIDLNASLSVTEASSDKKTDDKSAQIEVTLHSTGRKLGCLGNLTFDQISNAVRVQKPSYWWSVAHDSALVRSVVLHGNPNNAKRYEAICSDVTVGWTAPLDASKGWNGLGQLDGNRDTSNDTSHESEMPLEEKVESSSLITMPEPFPKRELLQRRMQALVRSAKSLLEKSEKDAIKAAAKAEKEARAREAKNIKRKGAHGSVSDSLKKFCAPVDNSWAQSLKSAFPTRPNVSSSTAPSSIVTVSSDKFANGEASNTTKFAASTNFSGMSALEILRAKKAARLLKANESAATSNSDCTTDLPVQIAQPETPSTKSQLQPVVSGGVSQVGEEFIAIDTQSNLTKTPGGVSAVDNNLSTDTPAATYTSLLRVESQATAEKAAFVVASSAVANANECVAISSEQEKAIEHPIKSNESVLSLKRTIGEGQKNAPNKNPKMAKKGLSKSAKVAVPQRTMTMFFGKPKAAVNATPVVPEN